MTGTPEIEGLHGEHQNHETDERVAEHRPSKGFIWRKKECPSCRWHKETQLHIFQCGEDSMENIRTNSFKLMEKDYHQDGIPGMVYVPFIKLCQLTCNDKPMPMQAREPVHRTRTVEDTIHAQCNLGHIFFLRGSLGHEWLVATQHFQKDKPEEKSSTCT